LRELGLKKECADSWNAYSNSVRKCFIKRIGEEEDIIWALNPFWDYKPKFGYKDLTSKGIENSLIQRWKEIWKFKCHAKSKIIMWLLLNNKSLTWDFLHK